MQGAISRGNLYPQGEAMLELFTVRRPDESLYLKRFVGGDYAEGVWLADRDEEIFQRMERNTLHWNEWSDTIPGMYESLYYVMNQSMWREDQVENMQLWIRPAAGGGSETYLPYYHMWYSGDRQEDGSYQVSYFERKDVDIDWDNVTGFFEAGRDWYYEIQEAYELEARDVYTEVAAERIPRLAQLCRDYLEETEAGTDGGAAAGGYGSGGQAAGRMAVTEQEDAARITAFILETLWSRASYTRTPGMYPLNADPVEYFLFESGEGYCQHFASAAVLMFRLLGVPARYAAGCVVYPEDFVRQEDGTWQAVATDESAHAWVEIFLPDYGWVPVEATPPASDAESEYWTAGPDGGAAALSGLLAGVSQEEREAAEALQQTESETAGPWQEQSEEEKAEGWSVRKEDLFEICRALLPQMILLAAILGCLPYGRRMWRLYRRNTSSGCREIFADLLDMLHACGMPEEYEGLETDFAARLSQMVPSITEAQAGEIVRIVSEEAYGGKEASRQELAFVRNRYYCAAQSLCRKQGWRRRLVFCYRYGYI